MIMNKIGINIIPEADTTEQKQDKLVTYPKK